MKKQYDIFRMGFCLLLTVMLTLGGCKKDTEKKDQQAPTIVVAKAQTSVTRLYFKGTLAPLKTEPVLSPVDGTITELFFKYGDFVKKDQNIASMDSDKLADDYREAVTKFLQAKDTYENSLRSYTGTEALYKAGVISADEYRTDKSQYETNTLNFYQTKFYF